LSDDKSVNIFKYGKKLYAMKKKALTGLKALFAKYKFNLKFLLIEHGGYACEL
jgi:hypothetical protein